MQQTLKERVTMWTKVLIFLIGTVFMYEAISQDIYISELMVESNVTLNAENVLSSWNTPQSLTVTVSGATHTVSLLSRELIADCLVIGEEYNCSCSSNYHWSNEVCYNHGCCRDVPCLKNVSFVTPICVAKANVTINGSIYTTGSWLSGNSIKVKNAFDALNGVSTPATITRHRSLPEYPYITDFELALMVRLNSSKLQEIMDGLKVNVTATVIYADTRGMVAMNGPNSTVRYESQQKFRCTLEEATGFAGWNLSREFERFELNNGLQVVLNPSCATETVKSCIEVTLNKVTGAWAGTYECGFMTGTVRHTARTNLTVALLPDNIRIAATPLTIDCSKTPRDPIVATVQITEITEKYLLSWMYNHINQSAEYTNHKTEFTKTIVADCDSKPQPQPHKIIVNFRNRIGQEKNASVDIPVILADSRFCPEEILDGQMWPKTPPDSTVINQTCPEGRVGYRSRTCGTDFKWRDVFPNCISTELKKVTAAADYFLDGLGATNSVAKDIFEGIVNNSLSSSRTSDDDVADISASINIVSTMARASVNISLEEDVFPKFVDAASNMLNSNWTGVNDTVRYRMSSRYLDSVENLVKNINVNTSSGFNSTNLDLRFCSSVPCNVSAFDVGVNVNVSSGTMKVVAVRNLMGKLQNDFLKTERTSLLVSATLVNTTDSDTGIKLAFPINDLSSRKRYCVFWDTKETKWSDYGCTLNGTDENNTVCVCNHLTSFSVLMAKSDISSHDLDVLTKIGLIVSVCSLIIFLFIEFLVWPAVIKTNLSHFRHTAVVNIAVFRLLADCSFLASSSPKELSESMCLTFTVCKHLFYLAKFTWMLCLSCMLVHQLIFVFSHLRKRVFMFLASIVGYILPMALVATSYVYYKYTKKDYFSKDTCWLTYESLLVGSIHAFLLPVGTIVLINLFSMVVVIVTLMKTSVPDSSKAADKETAKSILKVVVLLTPVFGVTWVIGFFLLLLDEDNPMFVVANYSFTILNSFQGLFILVTGVFAEQKVRDELIKIIKAKSGRVTDDSIKKSMSTTYTKEK